MNGIVNLYWLNGTVSIDIKISLNNIMTLTFTGLEYMRSSMIVFTQMNNLGMDQTLVGNILNNNVPGYIFN